jgi:hypothetical protein
MPSEFTAVADNSAPRLAEANPRIDVAKSVFLNVFIVLFLFQFHEILKLFTN